MKRALKAVVCAVLCACICLSLTACLKLPFGISVFSKGKAEIDGTIYKIDIDWPSGQVIVMGSGQNEIGLSLVAGDESILLSRQLGSTLFIKCAEGAVDGGTLLVRVPRDTGFSEIEIRTEGASATITDISAERLDVAAGGGAIISHDCRVTEVVELQTDTGSAEVSFDAPEYDLVTNSGEMAVTCLKTPEKADCDFSGGIINLILPSDSGFTAHGSGEMNFEGFKTEEKSGKTVCGDGAADIKVSTKDGTLNIISQ